MTSDRKEAQLLDALTDAQEAHARDQMQLRIGLWLLLVGLALTLVSLTGLGILHSAGVDWGWGSGLIPTFSIVAMFAGAAITIGTWVESLPQTRTALKQAQRNHQYYLMADRED